MEVIAVAAAWGVAVVAAAFTFNKVYEREGSFKKALTYSLILLKIFATVYWLAGLDRPLASIYYVRGEVVWSGTLTANMAVIIALAVTVVTINLSPLASLADGARSHAKPREATSFPPIRRIARRDNGQ